MSDTVNRGERTDLSINKEVQYLGWIARRVEKLSPAGRRWLMSWIRDRFGA